MTSIQPPPIGDQALILQVIDALADVPDDVLEESERDSLLEVIAQFGLTEELRAKALAILDRAADEESRRRQDYQAVREVLAASSTDITTPYDDAILRGVRASQEETLTALTDRTHRIMRGYEQRDEQQIRTLDDTEANRIRRQLGGSQPSLN